MVVCRLEETVSNVLFADQNAELTLTTHADRAFTAFEVFQAVLLTEVTREDTLFKRPMVLTRDADTVLSEVFVVQEFPLRFESVLFKDPNITLALVTLMFSTLIDPRSLMTLPVVFDRSCCTPVTVSLNCNSLL